MTWRNSMKSLKNLASRDGMEPGFLQGLLEVAGHNVIGELGLPDNLNIRRQ